MSVIYSNLHVKFNFETPNVTVSFLFIEMIKLNNKIIASVVSVSNLNCTAVACTKLMILDDISRAG